MKTPTAAENNGENSFDLAPRYYVIALLFFIVAIPVVVWKIGQNGGASEQPFICGNVSRPATNRDSSSGIPAHRLFQNNCASCHNLLNDAASPALKGILDYRNEGFLYLFLVKRNVIKKDSSMRERISAYKAECQQFPDMTKDQARRLEFYIRHYAED